MNTKIAALATTFLLTTGCANGPIHPPQLPDDSSPVAGATSSGSSAAGTEMASAGPAGRSRAEVYAEAVEAVKHYKSTQSEERDFFNPYAQH